MGPGRKLTPTMSRLLDPQGAFTHALLRPLSDLFLWVWRLERRIEFLYRPQFDRHLQPAADELPHRLEQLRHQLLARQAEAAELANVNAEAGLSHAMGVGVPRTGSSGCRRSQR